MNSVYELLCETGYKGMLKLEEIENLLYYHHENHVMSKKVPFIAGNDLIIKFNEAKKIEELQYKNNEAANSDKNFLALLEKMTGTEQKLIILLKKLIKTVDNDTAKSVFSVLKNLEQQKEYPVPIIQPFWNMCKTKYGPGKFREEKEKAIELYKTWKWNTKKMNTLSISTWNNRCCMVFDFYIPELKLRLELDGIQHNYFPYKQIDECSDKYFKELYGIETVRLSCFGKGIYEKEEKEKQIEKLITRIYTRTKENQTQELRDLDVDSVFLAINNFILDGNENERLEYFDELFENKQMQLKSLENLINEKKEQQ